MRIEDGEFIEGRLPRTARKLVLEWREQHVEELLANWELEGVLTGGVFVDLEDEDTFAQAEVDRVAGTICWPNGVDLDPDVLHGDFEPATGKAPKVLREYHLRPTG